MSVERNVHQILKLDFDLNMYLNSVGDSMMYASCETVYDNTPCQYFVSFSTAVESHLLVLSMSIVPILCFFGW